MRKLATIEQMTNKAVECLNKLQIHKPYIDGFRKEGVVTVFERYAGFWALPENNYEELYNIIKQFEEEHGYIVYAATHEVIGEDEVYSLLFVSSHTEDWDYILQESGPYTYYAMAYCHNVTTPIFSEMGDIVVNSFGGGIRRVY
jgi:hypothetical protein